MYLVSSYPVRADAKFRKALFLATFKYDGRKSVMESTLNTHPLALKYLIPSLIRIYVEVEQTGASSQFYDKFSMWPRFD